MQLKSKIRIRFILFRALVILLTVAVAGLAAGLIGYILKKGLPYVSWEFLTTEPDILMDTYGIKPMIINTIYTVVLTLLFCIPLGIGSAIYLAEYAKQGKIVSAIRFAIEILAGIPSIVYGLFGLDFFVQKMSIGDYAGSMLAASLTLTLIVLPTMIRTTEESLLAVSSSYREAAGSHGAVKILHHPQSDPALCHLRNRSGHYSQYRTNDQRIRSPFVHGGYCAGPANLGSVPCEGAGSHYDGTVVSVCHRRRGTGMGAVRHGSRVDAVCLVY